MRSTRPGSAASRFLGLLSRANDIASQHRFAQRARPASPPRYPTASFFRFRELSAGLRVRRAVWRLRRYANVSQAGCVSASALSSEFSRGSIAGTRMDEGTADRMNGGVAVNIRASSVRDLNQNLLRSVGTIPSRKTIGRASTPPRSPSARIAGAALGCAPWVADVVQGCSDGTRQRCYLAQKIRPRTEPADVLRALKVGYAICRKAKRRDKGCGVPLHIRIPQ